MLNEPLSAIMTTELVTVGPNDNLDTVRNIFLSHRIHHLPVTQDNKLMGILTTYDLFKLGVGREECSNILVKDAMTTRVATLHPTDKIGSAAEVFLKNLFHALPIVVDGDLVGIVTSFDVLKFQFQKEYPNEVLAM